MGTETAVESLGWEADSHSPSRSHVEGGHLLQFPGKPNLPEELQCVNMHSCSWGHSVTHSRNFITDLPKEGEGTTVPKEQTSQPGSCPEPRQGEHEGVTILAWW